ELRTVSRNGEATTTMRFAWGTDMQTTLLNVRERLDNARGQLPERADRPTLLTSDPGERPIAVLAMAGQQDLRGLARTAEEVHARRLEQITGVASVAVVGAPEDEIRIEVDPAKLRALDLTADDLATAVRQANANGAGGTIRRGQFRFAVRALTEFQRPEEIASTPIGPVRSGITLADVATITLTSADPKTIVRHDGKAAVGLVVYKDAGANTVKVTRDIDRTIETLTREFSGITLTTVAAQADFVVAALSNLGQEIILGGILSLLVILIFLRDWRTSLAIGVMVPLSVLLALVVLQALGVTVNVMSLGGLALGVGLLVDNAIVVAEASERKRSELGARSSGLDLEPRTSQLAPDRAETTIAATEEVAGPLTAGTLTTLLVFGPIIFVQGLAAALFRDLSLSVVTSVAASLILALTLMPVLITGRRSKVEGQRSKLLPLPHWLLEFGTSLADKYERGMAWCLSRPRTVFVIAGIVTLITALVAVRLPREVLPAVDERVAVASLRLAQGTAIEETVRQTARIESAARQLGSNGVYARVGVATDEEVLAGADVGSSATSEMLIPVPNGMGAAEFADALRANLPDLAKGGGGSALAIDLAGQSEFGSLIGREGRIVRAEVGARTLAEAERWADSVRRAMQAFSFLTDVRASNATTQPIIEVTLVRDRIAQHGLRIEEIAAALQGGLGGVEASELRETDRRTPITVRFSGNANENLTEALTTPVSGIPVGQLIEARELRAPIEVVRVGQRPVVQVEGLIREGGTSHATDRVVDMLTATSFPAGISWSVSGADAETRRTSNELLLVAILAAALVFLVLAGEFASFTVPLVVMLTVPLAAAGGLLFLWLTGQSINAVSLIGIVVMIGMADNEAVVKLDAIRRFREQGHSVDEAVMLGGRQRLRAIAMTSLTTITGVLPLVFGLGSGGALYQPLAAGVIGGSISALLVTFFLLPTAYAVLERSKERGARSLVQVRDTASEVRAT
ncbi:MAG TPA: efflux RND transporter permease subunit, partial [Gemmatimonadaceae bacterium]|nr:efflux RND transporter permease subunit [Gemmatimonadaceae bacterium]